MFILFFSTPATRISSFNQYLLTPTTFASLGSLSLQLEPSKLVKNSHGTTTTKSEVFHQKFFSVSAEKRIAAEESCKAKSEHKNKYCTFPDEIFNK